MRRTIASLLILSLLGGQLGAIGALLVGRHQARQRMRRRIAAASAPSGSSTAVQHLVIPRSTLQAPESSFVRLNEREFRYRGNLYDIVRAEQRGRTWHVWVLHDRREERYLELLAERTGTPILFEEESRPPYPQRPLANRTPGVMPRPLASPPAPVLHSRLSARVHSGNYQSPSLEVPHPPPWG